MSDVAFTSEMSVEVINVMGDDHSIANAARVSTGRDGKVQDEKADVGLINALVRDRHGSAVESGVLQFHIECPIFVAREFFRHRMASYSETSARYRELEPRFYLPSRDRLPYLTQTGKAMEYNMQEGSEDQFTVMSDMSKDVAYNAWNAYQTMLDAGIAKEVARNVLPVSIYTSFYVTMNVRSLLNFFSLRIGERGREILTHTLNVSDNEVASFPTHPLFEIEELAMQMAVEFAKAFPGVWRAFTKNWWVAP